MQKILFIDPICQKGHLNFNRIHLEALLKQEVEIDTVFTKDYFDAISVSGIKLILELDAKDIIIKNGFQFRLAILRNIFKVKNKIDLKKYSAIIFSFYDEISLALANFPQSYIINHTNISNLNSIFKKIAFSIISRRHKHIVLTSLMKKKLEKIGVCNAIHINHGMLKAYKPYPLPPNLKKYRHIIFSPSANSSDIDFNLRIIHSDIVQNWLIKHNAVLVFRGNYNNPFPSNIVILKERISSEVYQSLFVNASCILINYPDSFKYRASGVFFEAVSNSKVMIVREIEEFQEYSVTLPLIYFHDINTLIESFNRMIDLPTVCNYPQEVFNVDYSFLQNSIC